ncbi:hypothetical protein B2G71_04805 [Novosphingobium sp. PC22D]|uniref:hypothetical protein n=1 Tax=Novosphingobium sp. PC22D TaxID=1962403 RepID=UPI000BF0D8E4|nr:hypothetical protein [Novosphingobium sp. PC22D]PEQ13650.1 hypothetical protein B2G71_04805 [Novosphingobium sp. PC22D]
MAIELPVRERRVAALGGVSLAAALVCVLISPREALTGWLGAAVLFQALPMTALALLATMRLVPGEWEVDLRPVCEFAGRLWPLAALAFVPVLAGMGTIYDWSSEPAASDFQDAWLGYVPFALRTVLWFVGLGLIARGQIGRRAGEGASSAALVFLVLGGSLVAVDWLMSLDAHFHSSGFGLQVLAIEAGAAFMALLIVRMAMPGPIARPGILGGLLLTLMVVWAYFQFLPYLVIWSGNLPEGAAWYAQRGGDGWSLVLWVVIALSLAVLGALFFAQVRTRLRPLRLAAAIALAGKGLEFAWFALPGRGGLAVLAYALTLAGLAALGAAGLGILCRMETPA